LRRRIMAEEKKVKEVIYDKEKKQITGVIFIGNTTITPVVIANRMAKKGLIEGVIPVDNTGIVLT
jgi:hypothetical protein